MSAQYRSLRQSMALHGIIFEGAFVADGQLHRFVAEGDNHPDSWYVLHSGSPAAGAFGCWRRNISETWCERTERQMTQEEWAETRRQWQVADHARQRAEEEQRAEARERAAQIIAASSPAQDHSYLLRKGVIALGELSVSCESLVLPLRDETGTLHSLQFIQQDGTKRFLPSGRISGCFYTLAAKPDGPLVVCEGYATGASIHIATSYAVVCAMNCGNLLAVAQALRGKRPDREIIIAADNDQWTTRPPNPGRNSAREAATAIRARLAVPQFKDTTTKPTDFNDLQQLEGAFVVKDQIHSAETPKESDEEAFSRLAGLTPVEFDRCRKAEAKERGLTIKTLDNEVARRRAPTPDPNTPLQGSAVLFPSPDPWAEPVNGPEVLDAIAAIIAEYVVLPPGAADAIALWIAHTFCFRSFTCSPRLNICSPEKGCGKTTLRDVIATLVSKPLSTENLTGPVLFRVVEAHAPTLLADECDSWLRDEDELRGLLNAGHRRGATVLRCEGDDHEVRAFQAYAPAVLCGIGALPGTLHDRSIVVRLKRALPGELRGRFDSRRTFREQELTRKLVRWCLDYSKRLEESDPELPKTAFNRLADNWRPLFALAEVAGGAWVRRAHAAYAALTDRDDIDTQGIGVALLEDLRLVFAEDKETKIFSRDIIVKLTAMSDRPWPEARYGKPITAVWLAKKLKGFRITPRDIRKGDEVGKGYFLEDFREVFLRYLAEEVSPGRDTATTPENIDPSSLSRPLHENTVLPLQNGITANKDAGCSGVAAPEPPTPDEQPLFEL